MCVVFAVGWVYGSYWSCTVSPRQGTESKRGTSTEFEANSFGGENSGIRGVGTRQDDGASSTEPATTATRKLRRSRVARRGQHRPNNQRQSGRGRRPSSADQQDDQRRHEDPATTQGASAAGFTTTKITINIGRADWRQNDKHHEGGLSSQKWQHDHGT